MANQKLLILIMSSYFCRGASSMQLSMVYFVKDETVMLERWFQCGFMSGLGSKVSSTSPPPFGAVSLSFTPAAAAGKSKRLTLNVSDVFN